LARKGNAVTAMIEECDLYTVTEDQRRAAALIVCGNAKGDNREQQVEDARTLMSMLGLMPGQESEFDFRTVPTATIQDCI